MASIRAYKLGTSVEIVYLKQLMEKRLYKDDMVAPAKIDTKGILWHLHLKTKKYFLKLQSFADPCCTTHAQTWLQ